MGSQSLLKDSVVSFFKVMIDLDFLSVLYLPPKFARTAPGLLNKKTYLENLNGRRWNVVVSEENGSLVFRKGWSEFSMAHKLGIGDFVVFHYFLGQYFLVQVFNKSACDLRGLGLADGYPRGKSPSETYEEDTYQEDPPGNVESNDSVILPSEKERFHKPVDKTSTEVHQLAHVPVEDIKADTTNFEDPQLQFIMITRETKYEKKNEERLVIDLSNYEIPCADSKSCRPLAGNESSLPFANNIVKCEVQPEMSKFTTHRQELKCHVRLSESTKRKEVERSLYSNVKKKKYVVAAIESPSFTALSPKRDSDELKVTIPKSAKQYAALFKNAAVKIKKEVKTEPFCETGPSYVTASASDLHCPIKNAASMFLELPGSLPLFTSSIGTSDQELVLLHDSAKRCWPVYYHHKPTRKVFTTGWSAFMKANNIQSGDVCIFKAVNNPDVTYDVTIVRKSDKPA